MLLSLTYRFAFRNPSTVYPPVILTVIISLKLVDQLKAVLTRVVGYEDPKLLFLVVFVFYLDF